MADPFVGEIRIFAGNFAPINWAFCNGQLIPAAQNPQLFNVLDTRFGGDSTNFALPDLRGRAPLHAGSGDGLTPRSLGETGGTTAVTLTADQSTVHTHDIRVVTQDGANTGPQGNVLARNAGGLAQFKEAAPTVDMNAGALAPAAGGAQPHNNLQPYLIMSFIIALDGIVPTP